jgi:hypothetical protein
MSYFRNWREPFDNLVGSVLLVGFGFVMVAVILAVAWWVG